MSENLININALDRFSFIHFGAGYLVGLSKMPATPAYLIGILWEMGEPYLKLTYPKVFPNPVADSTINKVFDVIIYGIGYSIGARN